MSSKKHAVPLAPDWSCKAGIAGGLVLGFHWPLRAAPVNEPEQPPRSSRRRSLHRTPSSASTVPGKTTLVLPQAEMGQGVYTAIAMILAEELDADSHSCDRAPAAE